VALDRCDEAVDRLKGAAGGRRRTRRSGLDIVELEIGGEDGAERFFEGVGVPDDAAGVAEPLMGSPVVSRSGCLLCDRALLAPVVARWEAEAREMARSSVNHGRPTMPMDTYVRLMVVKHRYGWGYRTLMAEVSDSLHLRRFARIGLAERVPDESTVRKLTRRLGAEVVNDLSRSLIEKARREKRSGRGRCGSTRR
jgi:hypothetical protein